MNLNEKENLNWTTWNPSLEREMNWKSYQVSKKLPAKELYAHICSLTAMLNEDEKEEFYQEAEKEGF